MESKITKHGADQKIWLAHDHLTKLIVTTLDPTLLQKTAASFASASVLFKGEDDKYSAKLLDHAKRIYKFADECRGKYSDSIYDASIFYK